MTHNELAKKIYDICYLRGEFKLRSGQTSNEYFDKYRFESQPILLKEIAKLMAPMIPRSTQILAGLELGGVPVATALSLETGIPVLFVRKKAKDYGTCQFAEGLDFKQKNICIIEDIVTTGGQVLLSAEDLRKAGAIVNEVLCVINRGTENPLEKAHLKLSALFTKKDLVAFEKK